MTNEEKEKVEQIIKEVAGYFDDFEQSRELEFDAMRKVVEKYSDWKDEQHKINWKKVAKNEYFKAKRNTIYLDNKIDYIKTLHFELNKRDLEISNLNDEIATLKRKLSKYEEI